jgi:presenilin 1
MRSNLPVTSDDDSIMSESLTANSVTPYAQASTPQHSDSSNEAFADNPAPGADEYPDSDCSYSTDGSDDDDDEEDLELSLSNLLYSIGSFHVIVTPVAITMILAALSAVFVNNDETMEAGEEQFATAYNVWKIDDSAGGASNGVHLAASIVNTFVMILVIGTMTFGIVILYKYRCMKFLIGYMVLSSASLLGVLGDYMGSVAIEIYRIPVDVITWTIFMYNFAVVGVTAIFYQKGIPNYITQAYLVCTSVILAWHLSHFDYWTAWTLLGE